MTSAELDLQFEIISKNDLQPSDGALICYGLLRVAEALDRIATVQEAANAPISTTKGEE
jgi:hypothetical protein